MDGLFGGRNNKISTSAPIVAGFRVQTSAYGRPVPLVFGRTRVAANLLWYGDFTAIAHTTSSSPGGGSGGKGGGGAPTQENTTYTYTAAVLMLLSRGQVGQVTRVWRDKEITTLAALGLSFYTGSASQAAFPHLATNHPSEALAYRKLAYVASAALDLGESAQLMNHSFELDGETPFSVGVIWDANPAAVILVLAIEAGIEARIGDLTQFSNYCVANGIFVSPAYIEQRSAAELLAELARIGNAEIVPSEDKIKLVPYSDEAKTGNGVTYTPNATPIFEFTDADFLHTPGEEPVSFEEEDTSDAYNVVKVKFYNRAKDYAEDVVEAQDDDNIALYGRRPMEEPIQLFPIVDARVALLVATNELARQLYFRTSYRFKLGPGKADLLEPMDVISITRASLGVSALPVRVREIEELQDAKQDGFGFLVREFPAGPGAGVLYPVEGGNGYAVDYQVDPGSVNAPVILDAPAAATVSGFELWLAVSGSNANWGGAQVWVASDPGGPFKQVGSIFGAARHGVLSGAFAAGADPDTVNTCPVNLMASRGSLTGGTQADADSLNTLSWVEGEFFSFQAATLTAQYKYDLKTYLRRGAFNSAIAAHDTTKRFVRLDQAVFRYPYDPAFVGKTLYVKLPSFNIFGAAAQDLAAVAAYSYAIKGPAGFPDDVTLFSIEGTTLSWAAVATQNVAGYRVKFQPGISNTSWGNAIPLHDGLITESPFDLLVRPAGMNVIMIRAVDNAQKESLNSAIIVTDLGDALVANVVETFDRKAAGWPGILTGGAINGSNNLAASTTTLMWQTNADTDMWAASSAVLMWAAALYARMTYVDSITTAKALAGSRLTIAETIAGDPFSLEYRENSAVLTWSADASTPMWNTDSSVLMWDLPSWLPWPGEITVRNSIYDFRITTAQGPTQGTVSEFTLTVDAPDLTDSVGNLAIAAGGTRLPITQQYTSIKAVNLTLQAGGGTARTAEVIDKNAALGPLVQCFDSAHAATTGTVDAIIQGY